jgi:hypothetical protein
MVCLIFPEKAISFIGQYPTNEKFVILEPFFGKADCETDRRTRAGAHIDCYQLKKYQRVCVIAFESDFLYLGAGIFVATHR